MSTGGPDLSFLTENGQGSNLADVDGSNNLVMSSSGGAIAPGTITLTVNPNLGVLQNNGGPTPTLMPLAGSPVVGAGNAGLSGLPSVDQRGLSRPTSSSGVKPDDGAVQTQTTTTTVANVTTNYNSGGQTVTLTANVDTFGDLLQPVSEGQVAFILAGTGISAVTASISAGNPGVATATIHLPSTLLGGSYTIAAAYSDASSPSLDNASSGTGTLTLQTAAPAQPANSVLSVTDTNSPLAFNSGGETLDLQGIVNGGSVNEGDVVFSVNGVSSGLGRHH